MSLGRRALARKFVPATSRWSMISAVTQLNELGFYMLAGAPQSPAELIDEVAEAESLGLGSAFISERFNIKEAFTLSGAVGAVSRRSASPPRRRTTTRATRL